MTTQNEFQAGCLNIERAAACCRTLPVARLSVQYQI